MNRINEAGTKKHFGIFRPQVTLPQTEAFVNMPIIFGT